MSTPIDTDQLKNEWLNRLSALIADVRGWAESLDWSTRTIYKMVEDTELGKHQVPALLLQKETTRILLEPITREAPGADGVVDLYLLPAYDDIASLYHQNGGWQLHYMFSDQESVATIREAKSRPLSRKIFEEVIEEMVKNVV